MRIIYTKTRYKTVHKMASSTEIGIPGAPCEKHADGTRSCPTHDKDGNQLICVRDRITEHWYQDPEYKCLRPGIDASAKCGVKDGNEFCDSTDKDGRPLLCVDKPGGVCLRPGIDPGADCGGSDKTWCVSPDYTGAGLTCSREKKKCLWTTPEGQICNMDPGFTKTTDLCDSGFMTDLGDGVFNGALCCDGSQEKRGNVACGDQCRIGANDCKEGTCGDGFLGTPICLCKNHTN